MPSDNTESVKKIVLCIIISLLFFSGLFGLPFMTFAGYKAFIPVAIFVLVWLPKLFFLTIKDFDLGFKYSAYTFGFLITMYIVLEFLANIRKESALADAFLRFLTH
jgi:hypothetical protein